jgi:dihydroxyacetone kinase-like protein
MKKMINSVESVLEESLNGFAKAHDSIIKLNHQPHFVERKHQATNKVALISGGGSGHEPLHTGMVGVGMLDAACPGQIFTSPSPDQMLAAAQSVESGAGVLFIVKNYAGDVMNFEIAAEMLDCEHETVLVADDVSLPKDHSTGRRGVAGTTIVEKIVGAAAESGASLQACKALGDKVASQTASMGVALTSCTVPAIGQPTFNIEHDEMEVGVGIHGERGRETTQLTDARNIVDQIVKTIEADLELSEKQSILVHVNGFGATPLMELYLVYELAVEYLQNKNVSIVRSLVGNYTTSLDMAGCSITVTVMDDEMLTLWDAPVKTVSLNW